MACRITRLSYVLWRTGSHARLQSVVSNTSSVLSRNFHIGEINYKKRKTKEERVCSEFIIKGSKYPTRSQYCLF